MDALTAATTGLQALVDHDTDAYMRYLDEAVLVEKANRIVAEGRFRSFQEIAPALTRGSGFRVKSFRVLSGSRDQLSAVLLMRERPQRALRP